MSELNVKQIEEKIKEINKIVAANRLHKDREKALNAAGFQTEMAYMGSGGVGQIKDYSRLGITRVQVGYGYGKGNRALVVVIPW